ncbi:uncharacterized protein SPAPADRAFT_47865 [Spathaspora passalidarum NRRL Y-27907]|uniref:DNA-directed RNA polymerase, mitochondrial n=1 Tax=Spathaspora passalidarum (strain NRRL Y-27907 / 11-Y1) TaxID=619300 RepID=G3AEY0_SPAPN|nr:uncharacterized protein SPAPADRAFT_47865 [Spathaspora passalidarum NRRL Y-27907]EGW34784.1 hypothetical protein SPAPADRAFT_47865 [Spathaspora passalidarum NRRL Y-27907]
MLRTSLKSSSYRRSRALVQRLLPQIQYAYINTRSESKTLAQSAVAVSPVSRLLEPLKSERTESNAKHSISKLTQKSFSEIEQTEFTAPAAERQPGYYSSKGDNVIRQPFAREINYLKSLMESFVSDQYYEKAYPLLKTLSGLVTPEEFTKFANIYLEALVQDEKVSVRELEQVIDKMQRECHFESNNRTRALRLTKYLETDPKFDLDEFFRIPKIEDIRSTLSNVDIIGVDNLYTIFDHPKAQTWIPSELKESYHEYDLNKNKEIVEDTKKLQEKDGSIRSLEKDDLSELEAVDSFGLQIVRHSLLGLEASPDKIAVFTSDIKEIIKDMTNEESKQKITSGKLNYFEMYQLLETQEQRDQFNHALANFNLDRQKQMEIRGVEGAKEKWKHEYEETKKRDSIMSTKNLNAQLYEWYQKLVPLLQKERQECLDLIDDKATNQKSSENKERAVYAPFFVKIDPEKAAMTTILEVMKLQSTGGISNGMRALTALQSVGKALEYDYITQKLSKKDLKRTQTSKHKGSRLLLNLVRNAAEGDPNEDFGWSQDISIRLGAVFVSFLMEVAKVRVSRHTVETEQSAFFHSIQYIGGQRIGAIKLHSDLVKSINRSSLDSCVQPQHMPMPVKPKDWDGYYGRGQVMSPLVRVRDSPETAAYVKTAARNGNLDQVYAGLNVLGNTAWTVNKDIFKVISHYWNTGKEFLDIPGVLDKPILPPKPERSDDPSIKYKYRKLVTQLKSEFSTMRSQRCDANYKLEIARAFIGEKLYFPHNLDFRGRAYPISPHFNHLGGDMTRSLFLFWDGKELGERGLRWLKIQLANLYGFDKAPFDERVKFVEDNLQNVFESAKNPYSEDAWWKKADKPWQALGVCFDLRRAYKLPDPTKYVSHMAVHQDGTCNGLQHYAALGGDLEGAQQVNLARADRPQDVYAYVAGIVRELLEKDAQKNNKYALFLKDKINRKVVKPTVMTNVYGVTYIGALAQVRKQLEDYFPDNQRDSLQEHARYLTTHVFAAIRQLFENAHLIQDWLGESARRISKSVSIDYKESDNVALHSSAVIWTTPLNLPCVQPYRKGTSESLKTAVQTLTINRIDGAGMVDGRKQVAGFPPNFVHSLDATHMMMTAAACGERGLKFASVHDSFWTHAADVDTMNEQIREQFVKLHSSNLISLLKEEFEIRYKDNYQLIKISSKHPLVKSIKELKQQWTKQLNRPITLGDELYMERTRLEFLNSDDPQKIKAAQDMVTTIKLAHEYEGEIEDVNDRGTYEILIPLKFPEVPPKGEFDVNRVKDSLYFFS